MSARPALLVVVCGTATEIGKTWMTAAVASRLAARGLRISARKPAQSFDPADAGPTDAQVLAASTGEDPAEVCPTSRAYPVAQAPPMAAAALGRPVPSLAELLADAAPWPAGADVGFLETVGGVRSPVADDADSRDLLVAAGADVCVLVADAGLGTIDAVRGALDQLGWVAPKVPVLVALNRFDPAEPLHEANRAWLIERDGMDVLVGPDAVAERLDVLRSRRDR